jgi:broad specificity phosphatase PhoE
MQERRKATADLILVKHAMPHLEPDVPSRLWQLSDFGREGTKLLADRLAPYIPTAVAASMEPKATETAAIVAAHLGISMTTHEGLHENDRTGLGWLGAAELDARIARFFAEPGTLVMGTETADQAHARFATAVNALCAAHAAETIAVVAHGTVITLYVSRSTGTEPFPFWKRLGLPSFVILSRPALAIREVVESVGPTHCDLSSMLAASAQI